MQIPNQIPTPQEITDIATQHGVIGLLSLIVFVLLIALVGIWSICRKDRMAASEKHHNQLSEMDARYAKSQTEMIEQWQKTNEDMRELVSTCSSALVQSAAALASNVVAVNNLQRTMERLIEKVHA